MMKRVRAAVAVSVLTLLVAATTVVVSQEVAPEPATAQVGFASPALFDSEGHPFALTFGQQSEARKIEQAIRDASNKFKAAEAEADKRDAEEEMSRALETQYEYRLNQYEQHLDELEANLKTMREQLARKRAAKSDVVRLKLQMLKYEIDDLGWPSGSGPRLPGQGIGTYSVAPRPGVPALYPPKAKPKLGTGVR